MPASDEIDGNRKEAHSTARLEPHSGGGVAGDARVMSLSGHPGAERRLVELFEPSNRSEP
jgi:hypothetical protein